MVKGIFCLTVCMVLVLCGSLFSIGVGAAEIDCLQCHGELTKGRTIHPAVQMGCVTCHSGIDATEIPHKKTNPNEKGLGSDMPDLCYGCHDKSQFTQKVVHPALMMGCSSCHDPHSSDRSRLLKSEMPDLCFGCHDRNKFTGKTVHAPVGIGLCSSCHLPHSSVHGKLLRDEQPGLCFTCHDNKEFEHKNVHAPVQGGMCSSCHPPHASENAYLVVKQVNDLCLECHSNVRKSPHAVSGFLSLGHPLGGVMYVRDRKTGKKRVKMISDPVRPGKIFYCGSCHNPHSSDSPFLFRYEATSGMGLCTNCHKM